MKTYKIEVKLSKEQEVIYNKTVSACRFVYNLYVKKNEEAYRSGNGFIAAFAFDKWLNNEYIPNHIEHAWIKDVSSKAIKSTIISGEKNYKMFFKGVQGKPKCKKVNKDRAGYHFVRTGSNRIIRYSRNRIKVACMGWVTFKEMNYLPQNKIIKSGCIKKRAGRYFIYLLVDEDFCVNKNNSGEGVGVDLGVKEFMTCSNGFVFPNINKSPKIIKLEKKLRREQRALSRKHEVHKEHKEMGWANYNKNKLRVEKLYYRLECKRNDYINKCIEIIVEQKPKFITLENLNIKGMVKNKHLAKAIRDSKFCYTKQKIIEKAKKNGIEVREVNRFYPSSKTCSKCGKVKESLKLKERTYKCSCGLEIDRDLNAAFNLKKAKEYKVLTETTDGLSGSNDYGLYKNLGVHNEFLIPVETIQEEVVRSHSMLKCFLDTKRNTYVFMHNELSIE